MTKTPAWRRYLRFWRPDIAADVEEELRFHTEMRVAEYMARGMTEAEARGAVAERLGDVEAARAQCIEQGKLRALHARNADFVDSLRSDIRYAFRSLGRMPGWTAVALLTIALGIGATTAVFRVADTLILRPLPYPDASRVFVFRRLYDIGINRPLTAPMSLQVVRAFREYARSLEAVAPVRAERDELNAGADSILVEVAMIDTAFLPLAGVHPLIGRNFTAAEIAAHAPSVMLLGEDLWRTQYGASRDIIGKVVQFSGQSTTIIGVVPASLTLPDIRRGRAEVWVPFQEDLVDAVAVRLKPGVSRDAATQELATILKRSAVDKPWWRDMRYDIRLLKPQDLLDFRQALAMLTGAVALLLLVACTNVGHLQLARGVARQRELAIRQAIGAGRKRLVRQLVTEVLVIAVIGGGLAIPVAWAGLHLLQVLRPESLVALSHVQNDRLISVTAALAIGAGLAIGVGSALHSARRDLGLALRPNASSAPVAGRRLRGALVVGEIALSATLLVGALLLIHALYDLERKQLGFDATGLYSITFRPEMPGPAAAPTALGELIRQRAKGIPGVEGSTVALSGGAAVAAFETSTGPALDQIARDTGMSAISPEYFAMMGMPLVAGRTFDDESLARNEVIVNTTLARMLVRDGNPLGIRFRNARPIGFAKDWLTVIGVVPDVVDNLLSRAPQPQIYAPFGNPNAIGPLTLYVRLRGEPSPGSLTRFAASVQPSGTKPVIASVRQQIDISAAEPRFAMRIMTIFAALGVLLAAVGLFGVVSYTVSQRTREIGVRMTLGATRAGIARLVVGDGVRLVVIGIAVGLGGAVAATRLIQSLLFGVSRVDPFAFGAGAVLLLAVALVACVVPMWRATAVDPVIAVRSE